MILLAYYKNITDYIADAVKIIKPTRILVITPDKKNVEKLKSRIGTDIEPFEVKNKYDIFSVIIDITKKYKKNSYAILLTNESTMFNFIIIIAVKLLNLNVAKYLVYDEILFEFGVIPDNLDQIDIRILKAIKEGNTKLKQISNYTNVSISTVWRRLRKMMKAGIVIKRKRDDYDVNELVRFLLVEDDRRQINVMSKYAQEKITT